MSTGWLKQAMIQTQAPAVSLISKLRKNLGGFQSARSHEVVHASDITKADFCPRQWALLDLLDKKPPDQYLGTALRATYDIGRATAKLLVEDWMGDAAVGNWTCLTCGDQRTFCRRPKDGCTRQRPCHWIYVEVQFESQAYRVSGSIDLFADLDSPRLQVTEVKIIKVEDYDKLGAPLPEHRIRTSLYLKLIGDSDSVYKDRINLHEARVLYVSRGYGKANPAFNNEILPFKEFVVKRDDETTKPYLQRAYQLKVFRDAGPDSGLIPSGICGLPTDKIAKGCSVCSQCFSGKYSAGQPPL